LIEKQTELLDQKEQHVLAVACVAGAEFSTAAVAAGLAEPAERVEEWCAGLARRGHFLRSHGMAHLPNGTLTARYGFLHAVYQRVLYERLAAARRVRLHRRIGEGAEAAYGHRVGEIAAELARHFEQGRDYGRAVQYLRQAAQNALRRSANREAIAHLTKGLELLKTWPDTPERSQQELTLRVTLTSMVGALVTAALVELVIASSALGRPATGLSLSARSLSFGSVPVGIFAERLVTMTNTANVPLEYGAGIDLPGNPPPFNWDTATGDAFIGSGINCLDFDTLNFTLQPGQLYTWGIIFGPQEVTRYRATWTVFEGSDGSIKVRLTGSGS
jgi:hypothetical protein